MHTSPADSNQHLIAAARAILRDGGRRPEGQEKIAHSGGPTTADEDIVLQIWPERGGPWDPDGHNSDPFDDGLLTTEWPFR